MSDDNGVKIDFDELNSFIDKINSAAQGGFAKASKLFLEGIGNEFLRITPQRGGQSDRRKASRKSKRCRVYLSRRPCAGDRCTRGERLSLGQGGTLY